jgi:protein polybromo-1
MVAKIDTMWLGPDGMAYFNGPWFVVPAELPPQPDRKFFKAEAFLSTISDSNPLLSVVGKCIVLVSFYVILFSKNKNRINKNH